MPSTPVKGDGCQGEDAGVHGEENDEVHNLARGGSEEPPVQGVDGGLEGHAEDDREQVGDGQVERE